MKLWQAVNEMLNDYYSEFGRLGVQDEDSHDLFRKIIDRAMNDLDFRKRLVSSPVKVLAREGFKLPGGFNVKFVEETENTIFIPIPPYIGEGAVEEGKSG